MSWIAKEINGLQIVMVGLQERDEGFLKEIMKYTNSQKNWKKLIHLYLQGNKVVSIPFRFFKSNK